MKRHLIYSLLFLTALLTSCDEGTIYEKELVIPQEGLTLKMTGSFTGLNTWPSSYQLVLASFADETLNKYKLVDATNDGKGTISINLSGLKDNITQLQLCIMERASRKSIIAYQTIEKEDMVAEGDTIYMNVGDLDVSMYHSIQSYVFDSKCINCHGLTGSAPRGLFLTSDKSYASLVDQPSKANPDYKLVEPGKAGSSLLPLILNSNGLIGHDHADILDARNKSMIVSMLRDWINNGAQE